MEGLGPACLADYVIILLCGKEPTVQKGRRGPEDSLQLAQARRTKCKLEKTELCLLTRKTKIGQIDELFIRNKTISISSKAK